MCQSFHGLSAFTKCTHLLSQDVMDYFSMHICQSEVSSLMSVGELLVIDSEAMQHGRVEIVNMNWFVDNVVAEIICFTVDNSGFYPTTCHPFGVAAGMMVTAVVGFRQASLTIDCSSKFSTPYHKSVVQHSSLF